MKAYFFIIISFILVLCFGCQDVFTYSPLDFLERDPKTLSKEQQLLYAKQALSSGNEDAMEKALSVVEDQLADDPNNAELLLLTGDLKWTLSRAPIAMQNYLFDNNNEFPDPGDPLAIDAFLNYIDTELTTGKGDITYMQEAADDCYYVAKNPPVNATLHPMQQLAMGLGLLSLGNPYPPPNDAYDNIVDAITDLIP